MNNPNIVALQWRTLEEGQQQCVTVLKVGETKEQVEAFLQLIVKRMKEMGVAYQKNVKKNVKIMESEVSQKSVAQMDI